MSVTARFLGGPVDHETRVLDMDRLPNEITMPEYTLQEFADDGDITVGFRSVLYVRQRFGRSWRTPRPCEPLDRVVATVDVYVYDRLSLDVLNHELQNRERAMLRRAHGPESERDAERWLLEILGFPPFARLAEFIEEHVTGTMPAWQRRMIEEMYRFAGLGDDMPEYQEIPSGAAVRASIERRLQIENESHPYAVADRGRDPGPGLFRHCDTEWLDVEGACCWLCGKPAVPVARTDTITNAWHAGQLETPDPAYRSPAED